MAKGGSEFADLELECQEDAGEYRRVALGRGSVQVRVLEIQPKLHQWASDGPERRLPNDAKAQWLNQRRELVESRMRGNAHVRFGGRAEETGWA